MKPILGSLIAGLFAYPAAHAQVIFDQVIPANTVRLNGVASTCTVVASKVTLPAYVLDLVTSPSDCLKVKDVATIPVVVPPVVAPVTPPNASTDRYIGNVWATYRARVIFPAANEINPNAVVNLFFSAAAPAGGAQPVAAPTNSTTGVDIAYRIEPYAENSLRAATPGSDFDGALSGILSIPAGAVSGTIPLTIKYVKQGDKALKITLLGMDSRRGLPGLDKLVDAVFYVFISDPRDAVVVPPGTPIVPPTALTEIATVPVPSWPMTFGTAVTKPPLNAFLVTNPVTNCSGANAPIRRTYYHNIGFQTARDNAGGGIITMQANSAMVFGFFTPTLAAAGFNIGTINATRGDSATVSAPVHMSISRSPCDFNPTVFDACNVSSTSTSSDMYYRIGGTPFATEQFVPKCVMLPSTQYYLNVRWSVQQGGQSLDSCTQLNPGDTAPVCSMALMIR